MASVSPLLPPPLQADHLNNMPPSLLLLHHLPRENPKFTISPQDGNDVVAADPKVVVTGNTSGASSPASMASVLPAPAIQDLKVTFQEPTLVLPAQKTERRSVFLSNIDQMHNYYVATADFFAAHPDFPPQILTERLRKALEKVLVPYDFAAGRLTRNEENGRLEIDCNAAGAGFVVASSECSLDDLGDLVFSNPGFRQLAVHDLWPDDDRPICIIQVTSFKCGGFAIGFVTNHVLFDGIAAPKFLANLATQAFDYDKPFDSIPCNDRHLLAARSRPLVSFPHPEYCVPENLPGPKSDDEEVITKIFKLTSSAITYLKNKAKDPKNTNARITTYNVVAALVWRCKALSNSMDDKERMPTLLTSIDIRARLNPPLPASYSGNGVLFAPVSMKCEDLEKGAFGEVVREVAEGPKRFTDEYARSVIDLLGSNVGKMKPNIEYNVSSWLRVGFDQVEYPWGKPISSGPLLHVTCVCFLFPNVDGGINALVNLPLKEMERFQACFLEFFS